MGCRLIVHADDFGLSEAVNTGIADACRRGILRSTSLIAPGLAFDHAVALARQTPGLDLGIHLTLIEEQPLAAPETIPSLVNAQGRFLDHATSFTRRYLQGKVRLDEIRHELSLQIEKVLDTGLPISHLDSHQHTHMLPGMWHLVCSLAEKYRIGALRIPRERPRWYMLRSDRRKRILPLLALNTFCHLARPKRIPSTDHFAGFFFGGAVTRENLATLIRHLPPSGTVELMCHPGHADPACRYTHWQYSWAEELQALTDPGIERLLGERGIQLIGWHQL